QLLIPESVFAVIPYEPIIFEPVTFSISHLLSDGVMLQEAKWDFNGDGEVDEVTSEAEIDHTFTRLGISKVSTTIILSNQTQISMQREIEIREPSPLPFEVEIITQPENLIGPAPFGVLFTIETNEPVEKIEWSLGEGNEASGDRVGHTFRKNGNYYVSADVYSESGDVAKLRKTVRVVDVLHISDLEFDGTPKVQGRKLKSEVPVEVDITPRTNQPLIDFYWEAPSASSVESNKTTLKAIYKKAGIYTITLVGTDPSGSVLRLPLTLEVLPPSSLVSIIMNPAEGVAPLSVRFDASETVIPGEDITGFEWRFGDELQEPIHGGAQIEYLFESPGTYKVSVNALTTSGKTFNAEKTIVVRAPVLNACFTTSRTSGKAPLGVSFNMSCTTGTPTGIQWDFGDGVKSIEKSPVHVFERPGNYAVFLRLQDEQGTTSQEILTITANP
ncbi:MAG: PKD domain-containing protein, partial [Candidatus Peribacteraceae bacterium]|nr:PKD domain-containing protein [Candidatus Peribacteraceae bacterium]